MRLGFAAPLLLVSGLALAPTASAQAPADPESLRHAADEFEAGRRAFKARDYESAAVHFENADRAVPNPGALRSAIRARRDAKQLDRAATLAALALDRHPEDKALRAYAEGVISASERQLHRVEVHCEPECSVALNNRVTPYEHVRNAVLYVEPGDHSIVAGWSGNRTQKSEITAIAGASTMIELVAPEEPPPSVVEAHSPAAEAEKGQGSPTMEITAAGGSGLPPQVFWAGAGLTAVLGGVTIWSGLDTQANPGPDKVRAECAGQASDCALYQDGLSRQRRTNVLLVATGAVGVATAIVGIFATDWGTSAEPATTGGKLVPVVGLGDGVTLGAAGRF